MSNMPDGFGSRSIDHDYFDYPDPVLGCENCGETFTEKHPRCPVCDSRDLTDI